MEGEGEGGGGYGVSSGLKGGQHERGRFYFDIEALRRFWSKERIDYVFNISM